MPDCKLHSLCVPASLQHLNIQNGSCKCIVLPPAGSQLKTLCLNGSFFQCVLSHLQQQTQLERLELKGYFDFRGTDNPFMLLDSLRHLSLRGCSVSPGFPPRLVSSCAEQQLQRPPPAAIGDR